jgi:hydrogenase nickel incorporation protein HypA/HybF
MHEFSMTTQIVEHVLQEAKKHDAKKVTAVYLVIGQLTFLGIEQVRFSYDTLVKGTIMEGSELFIEEAKAKVLCRKCGYKGAFPYEDDPLYHLPTPTLHCPQCGSKVEVIGGKECTIKRVKLAV